MWRCRRNPARSAFMKVCSNRVLRFSPLADAVAHGVTGELISKYAHWRRSTSAEDSVLTVNGELRTLRRMLHLHTSGA